MAHEQRTLQRAQKAEGPRLEHLSKLFGLSVNGRAGWSTSERRTSTGNAGAGVKRDPKGLSSASRELVLDLPLIFTQ